MDDGLELAWRPFAFRLPRQLVTAQGALVEKRGWLLRLQAAAGLLKPLYMGLDTPYAAAHVRLGGLTGEKNKVNRYASVYSVAAGRTADRRAEYAERAVGLLRKAVQAGYKNHAHMKADPDLDPLRKRADFQKLLADLEAKFPPRREVLPPPQADK